MGTATSIPESEVLRVGQQSHFTIPAGDSDTDSSDRSIFLCKGKETGEGIAQREVKRKKMEFWQIQAGVDELAE